MINGSQEGIRWRLLVRPSYAVSYAQKFSNTPSNNYQPKKNTAEGVLRKKSIQRLRNCVEWLRLFSEPKYVWQKSKRKGYFFKLNFITLTLSDIQVHEDSYIVRHMLQPFIKWMQREAGVRNYVWRTEVQPKRLKNLNQRCIHFHITTNKFIHWRKIRSKWNDIQARHGYTTDGADENSTDVHAIINEGKIVNYIAKYMTKVDANPLMKVYCKVWGANHSLGNLKAVVKEESHNDFWKILEEYRAVVPSERFEIPYITIYKHRLTTETQLPLKITEELMHARKLFMVGDDGVKKYVS